MSVTIYHNPACGTSRNTLAMIRQSGEAPEVIEYLKNPPSRARLIELAKAMAIPVRALLREKGTPYAELGLADPKWSDDQLLDFMLAHPILINRPIVVTPKGTRLCRPSEAVLDLLEHPVASFVKEDGVIVAPAPHAPRVHLPGHVVAAVDATGAGDSFAGALLARMVAGDDLLTATRYANAAAAIKTMGFGAVAPIPSPDQVHALLNA